MCESNHPDAKRMLEFIAAANLEGILAERTSRMWYHGSDALFAQIPNARNNYERGMLHYIALSWNPEMSMEQIEGAARYGYPRAVVQSIGRKLYHGITIEEEDINKLVELAHTEPSAAAALANPDYELDREFSIMYARIAAEQGWVECMQQMYGYTGDFTWLCRAFYTGEGFSHKVFTDEIGDWLRQYLVGEPKRNANGIYDACCILIRYIKSKGNHGWFEITVGRAKQLVNDCQARAKAECLTWTMCARRLGSASGGPQPASRDIRRMVGEMIWESRKEIGLLEQPKGHFSQ